MDFVRSWKFMAVIVAVLAAVAMAGVIYGVTTHTEAGLMEVTPGWQPGDFPLATCTYTYGGSVREEDRGTTSHVLNLINARLGFEAFQEATEACVVSITYGEPVEDGWQDPGGTATIRDGFCGVAVSNVSGELVTLVVEHELGHCLGLAHDDYDTSIMRPRQSVTRAGAYPPRISDSDVELLRSTYLR